jgi:hypothetical protein
MSFNKSKKRKIPTFTDSKNFETKNYEQEFGHNFTVFNSLEEIDKYYSKDPDLTKFNFEPPIPGVNIT